MVTPLGTLVDSASFGTNETVSLKYLREINLIEFDNLQNDLGITLEVKNSLWPGIAHFNLYEIGKIDMHYPHDAFAIVRGRDTDEPKTFLRHHSENVECSSDTDSVDLKELINCFDELPKLDIKVDEKISAYRHLQAHAKVILDNKDYYAELFGVKPKEFHRLQFFLSHMEETNLVPDKAPPTVVLKAEKLFRVGKWQEHEDAYEWTKEDLEDMSANFHKVKDTWFLPPAKVSHNESWINAHDELALGYITNVWVEDDYLYGDIELNQDFDYDYYFKSKRLRYKSVEIYRNVNKGGNSYKNLLKAVAFLGISTPAVDGLGEVKTFSTGEELNGGKGSVMCRVNFDEKEGIEMAKEVTQNTDETNADVTVEAPAADAAPVTEAPAVEQKSDETAKFAAEFAAMKAEMARMKRERDEFARNLAAANDSILKLADEKRKQENAHLVENLIKDGNIAPIHRHMVTAILDGIQSKSQTVKFSVDENTTEDRQTLDLFREFLGSLKAWKNTDSEMADLHSEESPLPSVGELTDDGEIVQISNKRYIVDNAEEARRISAYQEDHKCDYITALNAILDATK